MDMSAVYGEADEKKSIAVLHRALDLGINFWETARMKNLFPMCFRQTVIRFLSRRSSVSGYRTTKEAPLREMILMSTLHRSE